MELYISTDGTCQSVYDETVDLRLLGPTEIREHRMLNHHRTASGPLICDHWQVHYLVPFPLAVRHSWQRSLGCRFGSIQFTENRRYECTDEIKHELRIRQLGVCRSRRLAERIVSNLLVGFPGLGCGSVLLGRHPIGRSSADSGTQS